MAKRYRSLGRTERLIGEYFRFLRNRKTPNIIIVYVSLLIKILPRYLSKLKIEWIRFVNYLFRFLKKTIETATPDTLFTIAAFNITGRLMHKVNLPFRHGGICLTAKTN